MSELHFTARNINGTSWGGAFSGSLEALLKKQFKAGATEVAVIGAGGTEVFRPDQRRQAASAPPPAATTGPALDEAIRRGNQGWYFPLVGFAIAIGNALFLRGHPTLSLVVMLLPLLFVVAGFCRFIGAIAAFRRLRRGVLLIPIGLGLVANAPTLIVIGMLAAGAVDPRFLRLAQ